MQFLSEVQLIQEAEHATYELSDDLLNCVILSGEIFGESTYEKIKKIGKKYNLLMMDCDLSILYRES
ncbi:hypothetical protein TYM08_P0486 [Marinicellulosiphila megalodicopiae]